MTDEFAEPWAVVLPESSGPRVKAIHERVFNGDQRISLCSEEPHGSSANILRSVWEYCANLQHSAGFLNQSNQLNVAILRILYFPTCEIHQDREKDALILDPTANAESLE